ncbi:MAG TPA: glycosyltransferase family 4 protein [Rhizomicrobium sp.]|nr:glycosyltransferase family 4 protein [Rhizomicrobium sp.]
MPDPSPDISILTATTLFPNSLQPSHGVFVETRLRHLTANGKVRAHVLAPVPWAPPLLPGFAKLRQVPDRERRNGFEVEHPRYVVIPKIGMNLAPHTLYRAMRHRFRQLLNSGVRVDLIDAHYFYPDGIAATWLAREFRLPLVITARGTDINLIPEFARPRQRILDAAQSAGAIVTVCQALKDRMVELGAPASKITVLRNGVDLKAFRIKDREGLRAKHGLKGFVLASVGLLIERKGHHFVVEALTSVPDATLLLAGSGPEHQQLESLAARLGVSDRVRFLGNLDQQALCDVYNCADALVLASSREGWANVLLEAMACGTPVIGTAVWGTPEVIACPEAGLLLKNRDAQSIVEAIGALRRSLPERSATRHYAERFDWQATTDGQLKLFGDLIGKHRDQTSGS